MKILAISGSLRKGSSNTILLEAAMKLAPAGVEISLYEKLGDIPLFNPDLDDLDNGVAPPAVLEFRAQLQAVDAVLISSPEYAHGVSGVLKNALDWLVGSGEFSNKPVALINASPRSLHAHDALMETLRTITGTHVTEGKLTVSLGGRKLEPDLLAADPAIAGVLNATLAALVQAAQPAPADGPVRPG